MQNVALFVLLPLPTEGWKSECNPGENSLPPDGPLATCLLIWFSLWRKGTVPVHIKILRISCSFCPTLKGKGRGGDRNVERVGLYFKMQTEIPSPTPKGVSSGSRVWMGCLDFAGFVPARGPFPGTASVPLCLEREILCSVVRVFSRSLAKGNVQSRLGNCGVGGTNLQLLTSAHGRGGLARAAGTWMLCLQLPCKTDKLPHGAMGASPKSILLLTHTAVYLGTGNAQLLPGKILFTNNCYNWIMWTMIVSEWVT